MAKFIWGVLVGLLISAALALYVLKDLRKNNTLKQQQIVQEIVV